MLSIEKASKNQEISFSSINDNNPSSQQSKKYSSNKNDSFLSDQNYSRKNIFPVRHIKMKSINYSKIKNQKRKYKAEELNSSNRNILETNRKESVNKENCNNYNKKSDDNKSMTKSEQTSILMDNQIDTNISEMKNVKKTIPEQNWFKNITYVITLLNTVNLIMRTYPKKFSKVCNVLDYIFTICFIIETSIKIAFFGFIRNAKSYLRQTPLNILDFLITLGNTLNIILNILKNMKKSEKFPQILEIKTNYLNFSEFRLFSLMLFPLDYPKIFYGVNFYLLNIKNIFINLSHASVFIIFLYLVFTFLGLFFWRGRFSYFCHTDKNPINKNSFPLVDLFQNNFCGGSNKCNSRTDLCLSSKEFYRKGLLDKSVYKKEVDHSEFNYGITNFDNFFRSLLTVFISSTGDGWDAIMSMAMDAHNYWVSFVYFLIMESTFVLFVKNLILIVILLTFEKERELIKKNLVKNKITGEYSNQLLKNANSMKYVKKYSPIKKPDQAYISEVKKALKFTTQNYKKKFFICNKDKINHKKKDLIKYFADIIYRQYITRIIFNFAIILNVAIVLAEYIPGNYYFTKELSKEKLKLFVAVKLIIVMIYCIEQFFILLIIGPLKLFTHFYYCIDFIFSFLCFSIFFYEYGKDSSQSRNPSIMLGILRVLRFYNPEKQKNLYLKVTLNSVTAVITHTIYIIPIFLSFLISFSLFGFSLFHGAITYNEFGDYDENSKINEVNFNDFTNSLFSTFLILLQDDWTSLFYFCYRSEKTHVSLVLLFYILIVVFGQIILMSIILSFLFEKYHYNREKFENNFDTKHNLLCMQLELTKYYQIDKLIYKKHRDDELLIKNLLKMNKRLVGENKEMMLVGSSKIDFIKNKAKSIESFYLFRSNQLNKYHKEILIGEVFENYFNQSISNIKRIKHIKYYHFNLNYSQEYIEKKKNLFKKRNSVGEISINCIFNSKKNLIKPNNTKLKMKDLSSENQTFLGSTFRNNSRRVTRHSNKRVTVSIPSIHIQSLFGDRLDNDSIILRRNPFEKFESKSLDVDMKNLRKKVTKKLITSRKLLKISSKKLLNNYFDEEDEKANNINSKNRWENFKNSSLFIFHRKNKFRIFVTNLTSLSEYNYIITFLILLHTVVLWFDTPWVEKKSSQKHIVDEFNFCLNIIFIVEGVLKVIRFGFIINEDSRINLETNINNLDYLVKYLDESNIQNFEEKTESEQVKVVQNFMLCNNSQAYLRNPYNVIDFICIIVSLIDMLNIIQEGILLTMLRAIRSIKPIRFINSSVELRFIMKVFINSLGDVFTVLFMLIIYIIIVAIFGQTLFRDKANYKCSLGLMYLNKSDCVNHGGYWVTNPHNYSKFLYSFKNGFEIIMGENLRKIMEETYLLTKNTFTYTFFVLAAMIGNIFVLKLLLAVIIQAFRKIQKRDDPYVNLTLPEKMCLKIQNEMSQYNPNKATQFDLNRNSNVEKFVKIISNKSYTKVYTILIVVDNILYMAKYDGAPFLYLNIINYLNIVVTILLNIQVILNLMAYSSSSYNKKWNLFELIITLIGDIALILDIIKNHLNDRKRNILTLPQIIIEVFKSARIIRLLSLNDYFKELTSLFISIVPRLSPIIALLLIILIVYANLGTIIFGLLPYRTYINNNNNFNNFFNSLMMLFQLLTGSEWNMIMHEMAFHDCRNHSSTEYQSDYYCVYYNVTCFLKDSINHTFLYHYNEHRDHYNENFILNSDIRNNLNAYHLYCGSNGSYLYIISYIVICSILVMSLFVVFVFDSYEKSYRIRENKKRVKFMKHILKVWHKYDPKNRCLINPPDFVLLLKEIPPPYGLNYDRFISNNPLKYFKKRKEFLIFKKNLKHFLQNIEDDIIHFNEFELCKNYTGLPYCFQFNNFYVERGVKFFTDDIEMLKILNYLDLISFSDKTNVATNKTNTYIFKNENLGDIVFKNNYIHFIDMCMGLSKLITSRIEGIDISDLRENCINSYSCNKWMSNFNSNEVMELINLKEIPNTYRVINKLSNQILERAEDYYKVLEGKHSKEGYIYFNIHHHHIHKFGLLTPKNQRQRLEKPKVIKIFTRTTTRGSYILIPNHMINRKKIKSKNRRKSEADAFKFIKKAFGKK